MSKKLSTKKLKSYSVLSLSVVGAMSSAKAQIVYTDVNPDSTINTNGSTFNLDLDNNGVADFKFTLMNYTSTINSLFHIKEVLISPLNSNSISGSTFPFFSSFYLPFALNQNQVIGNGPNWKSFNSYQYMAEVDTSHGVLAAQVGNWIDSTNKYVGLKFKIGTETHYGWARLDVSNDAGSFTIKDYAYNTNPDAPVPAGLWTTTGIENIMSNDVEVYISNKKITLLFNNASFEGGTLFMLNILGQSVKSQQIEFSTQVDMNEFPAGTYFLVVKEKNGKTIIKKVLITEGC